MSPTTEKPFISNFKANFGSIFWKNFLFETFPSPAFLRRTSSVERRAAIAFFAIAFLASGCASPGTGQRVALDSLATAGGGAAAYFAGNKDPSLTTAGAVGGFVVSEAFQAIAKNGRRKAFNSGIEEGKAIGQEEVLKGLWEESNGLPRRGSGAKAGLPPYLTIPSKLQNGVLYDAHEAPSETTRQPEKILVPAISSTNATSNAHYEQFQGEPGSE